MTGAPRTGKRTMIKTMCDRLKGVYLIINGVQHNYLCMGTPGNTYFVIGGVTFHYVMYLPVNRPYTPLSGILLTKIQEWLISIKVIITDEVYTIKTNVVFHRSMSLTSFCETRLNIWRLSYDVCWLFSAISTTW